MPNSTTQQRQHIPNPHGAPSIYADTAATRRNFFLSDAEYAHLAARDPAGKGNASRGLRAIIAASMAIDAHDPTRRG